MVALSSRQIVFIACGLAALGLGGTLAVISQDGSFGSFPLGLSSGTPDPSLGIGASGGTMRPESLQHLGTPELEALAKTAPDPSDRSRARYLMALRVQESNARAALQWLTDLETDYPVLAAPVLSLRARLQEQQGESAAAVATWNRILENEPSSPAAAEALYALGKTDPRYTEILLKDWPAHPLSVEVALTRLTQNPDDLPRLKQVAQYGHYTFKLTEILDRLRDKHAAALTSTDWENIAFAYWETTNYRGAAPAYAQAPPTALNRYRAARSYHLIEDYPKARSFYQSLIRQFPTAPETALGLKHLATLETEANPQKALQLWQQLYTTFPNQAAIALVKKASLLEQLGSERSAQQARQSVLTQHSQTAAAAELRWQEAQTIALGGDLAQATHVVLRMQQDNRDSPLTAKASFEAGRWFQQLGQNDRAKECFTWTLRHQPQSYYAWRSAFELGLPVGDFTTLWQGRPTIQDPDQAPDFPQTELTLQAGSATLQELYRLGQYQAAWRFWQVEFTNRVTPTMAEQLTDGLVRVGVGDYLEGLFMLNSLAWREDPNDRSQYETLRQNPAFWQMLYPLAFVDTIQTWSNDRALNPLLVIALIRQESRFMPGIVSSAGAVGLMQVMPDTADWIAAQIEVGNYALNDPNDSIKFGTWYLNHTHEEWNGNSLLAVASYNAGPGNVQEWVDRFGFEDPDRFVEQIPFQETQGYVESVFENYWNYLRLYNPEVSQFLLNLS
ncbi:MAG: transglycosylase SLT domain-containing protein [Prochlorotrichaceae cyanobacterium]